MPASAAGPWKTPAWLLRWTGGGALAWILAAALLLRLPGLGWGLPGPDGWDDDGVAPRDFLVGVVQTYQPGEFFRYPPVHLLLLSFVTLPIWLVGLLKATALTPQALVHEFIQPPYMTMFAVIARLVTVLMSLGVVALMARLAEEVYDRRTGLLVAVVVGLNAPFTYYSQTTNLEVPYLFWSLFALLELARAMIRHEPGRLPTVGLLAALAVGTKDQAGALLLCIPLALAGWFVLDPWPRKESRLVLRKLARAALIALSSLALLDGALVNPHGFAARVRFLLGSGSQDHALYPDSWAGYASVLSDSLLSFGSFYPWPFLLLIVWGLLLHLGQCRPGSRLVAGLLPLLAALSLTLAFNCLARRTEHRFLLPQTLLLGFYAGLAVSRMFTLYRRAAVVVLAPLGAWALFNCLAVDANLLGDPRYDAEAFLRSHVRPGELIEVYGNHVYWPRLPARARVVRVDDTAVERRSALLGVTEVEAPYQDVEQRRPRWIVVSEVFSSRYRSQRTKLLAGYHRDSAAREYFHRLERGQAGYRVAHVSRFESRVWPRVQIHASTGNNIWIFERLEQAQRSAP